MSAAAGLVPVATDVTDAADAAGAVENKLRAHWLDDGLYAG